MIPSVSEFSAVTSDAEDSNVIRFPTAGSQSGGPVRTGLLQGRNSGTGTVASLLVKGRINSNYGWITVATVNVAAVSGGTPGGFSSVTAINLWPEMMITNGTVTGTVSVIAGIVS